MKSTQFQLFTTPTPHRLGVVPELHIPSSTAPEVLFESQSIGKPSKTDNRQIHHDTESYDIGHDDDDPDRCKACGADFDLDGYCVGCGAPADLGSSDENEDEEDALSDFRGPQNSPLRDEVVVRRAPPSDSDEEDAPFDPRGPQNKPLRVVRRATPPSDLDEGDDFRGPHSDDGYYGDDSRSV